MEQSIIWDDLKFFLTRLKFLPISESLSLGKNGGFCVSTRCASENWIYYPENLDSPEIVNMAVKFFHERNISFMWPVYDGGREILEYCGLLYAGSLTAMSMNPKALSGTAINSAVKFMRVNSDNDAKIWARTAWHGFGGGIDDTPENYYALVNALYNDRENMALYIAEFDGKISGTFLITTGEKNLTGIYYFAVIPEFRRLGIASAMMTEICRLSNGKKLVLQATPSGLKFYKKFGFDELFRIPVYSTEEDIF